MQVSDTTSSTPILPPHCVFSLVDLHLPLPVRASCYYWIRFCCLLLPGDYILVVNFVFTLIKSTELGRYAGSSAARTDLHAGRRGQDDGARARPGPCRWPHCGCHPAAALPHRFASAPGLHGTPKP